LRTLLRRQTGNREDSSSTKSSLLTDIVTNNHSSHHLRQLHVLCKFFVSQPFDVNDDAHFQVISNLQNKTNKQTNPIRQPLSQLVFPTILLTLLDFEPSSHLV